MRPGVSSTAQRLWLVRHAQPIIEPGVCYGALDVPAQPEATQTAAQRLAGVLPFGAELWTSPLQRCECLAQALKALRPDFLLKTEARLREMNFGAWEGLRWDDVPRAELDAWAADFAHHRCGGAQSVAQLMAQVASCWDAWRALPRPRPVVWVTHAGVIRAAWLLAQGRRHIEQAQDWPAHGLDWGEGQVLEVPASAP
ncbi:MAG: alpha-ribazole phosphatase [Rhodoferax sp.]